MTFRPRTLVFFCLLGLSTSAMAADPTGEEIATEAERRASGWGDSSVAATMTLRRANGSESTRKIRTRSLEVEGDGDKSLTIFDEPSDVKGTGFLSFAHLAGNDDQWLYLPALGRVKRVSSSNRSGPFMGSEFAFEDIGSEEPKRFQHTYLRTEDCADGLSCFVVERVPLYAGSGYTKQVVWIDSEDYRFHRTDFYDRKGELLKTLVRSGFTLHEGKQWRAGHWKMVNIQTGKETTLVWSDHVFGLGLTDADFDQNALRRAQ